MDRGTNARAPLRTAESGSGLGRFGIVVDRLVGAGDLLGLVAQAVAHRIGLLVTALLHRVTGSLERVLGDGLAARLACFRSLERALMTKVVPWVPYLWRNRVHITGPTVTKWEYDQSTRSTAYAHVAVR
jgi:hypothetical protein